MEELQQNYEGNILFTSLRETTRETHYKSCQQPTHLFHHIKSFFFSALTVTSKAAHLQFLNQRVSLKAPTQQQQGKQTQKVKEFPFIHKACQGLNLAVWNAGWKYLETNKPSTGYSLKSYFSLTRHQQPETKALLSPERRQPQC